MAGQRIIVHREPADRIHRSVEAYSEEESVAPLAAPGKCFAVKGAFKPPDR